MPSSLQIKIPTQDELFREACDRLTTALGQLGEGYKTLASDEINYYLITAINERWITLLNYEHNPETIREHVEALAHVALFEGAAMKLMAECTEAIDEVYPPKVVTP